MRSDQWTFALAVAVKPFAAVLFLWVAMKISRVLMRFVPDGRVKRLLLTPLNKRRG